jgi:hypothetical protein
MTFTTHVGQVTAIHRLALGVECFDALHGRLVLTPVRVGRQVDSRYLRTPLDPAWPCLNLERSGPARFKLRQVPSIGSSLIVRFDDPQRRYVPRRFIVHSWPASALDESSAQPYVPVRSRVLRSWLWPGSAYPFPRGTTMVRGRVTHNTKPVRWARLTAWGPTDEVAGRAHADDRGEFVLVITNPGQNPVEATIPVDIEVIAARTPNRVDNVDRTADLVAEDVPRSSSQVILITPFSAALHRRLAIPPISTRQPNLSFRLVPS